MFPESELSQKDVELIPPLLGLVSCESASTAVSSAGNVDSEYFP